MRNSKFLVAGMVLSLLAGSSLNAAESGPADKRAERLKRIKEQIAKPGEGSLFSPTTKRGESPEMLRPMDALRSQMTKGQYPRRYNVRGYNPILLNGLNPTFRAIDQAAYGPTLSFTTDANFGPGNAPGGPVRYQMYTTQNQNGGQTSIIYDRFSGTARGVEQLTSFGNVYYGPRTPGTGYTRLPVSFADGNGTGSFSGNVQGPSFGNVGPFGMPWSVGVPSNATTPSFINPSYGIKHR